MQYPATFTKDHESGGYVVTFRDLPEAITQGDNDVEAVFMARDVLKQTIDTYLGEKRPLPAASKPKRSERLIAPQLT